VWMLPASGAWWVWCGSAAVGESGSVLCWLIGCRLGRNAVGEISCGWPQPRVAGGELLKAGWVGCRCRSPHRVWVGGEGTWW